MAGDGDEAEGFGDHFRGSPSPGSPVPEELIGLLSAVPVELTDGEVTDGLLELIELAGRAQAAVARFTASFDARNLPSVDGARSVASWLAARTEFSRSAGVGALACGRGLRECPAVDSASAEGRIGMAKVRMLLDARDKVEELFAQHEQQLVDDVAPLTVEQARRYIDTWREIALATVGEDDGPQPGDDPDLNEVHLSSTFQNRWRLDGDLDDLTGDAMAAALDKWIDTHIRSGRLDPMKLRRSQMRAMALAALVGVGAASSAPRTQRRADVHINWDAADLLGQPVADMVELEHRRCITGRGTHLSRFAASEALCNADVTDLLTYFGVDGTATVLGTVHTRRYPTERERAALEQRDGGCAFPGCDAPARWCDAHHTIEYEPNHRTKLEELVLLCPHHHRQVHRGFTLTRSVTGQIRVARPDGTRLDPGSDWDAQPVDPRHKLPPPTRFRPQLRQRPPEPPPEPFDPAHEAAIDAAIRQRLLDLRAG